MTSSKFSLICFRCSYVSSHRWSRWYHRTFRSQIVRLSQITYPIRIQQTTRLAKKSNWIYEKNFSKWCDNESIQATLFPFKKAGICYTRFIFTANHWRLLNLWVKWKRSLCPSSFSYNKFQFPLYLRYQIFSCKY